MYVIFDSYGGRWWYWNEEGSWVTDFNQATRYEVDEIPPLGDGVAVTIWEEWAHPAEISGEITQEDIDKAVRCDPDYCAVANALVRAVPDAGQVSVFTFAIMLDGEVYGHSKETADMLARLDSRQEVRPTTFTIRRAIP